MVKWFVGGALGIYSRHAAIRHIQYTLLHRYQFEVKLLAENCLGQIRDPRSARFQNFDTIVIL